MRIIVRALFLSLALVLAATTVATPTASAQLYPTWRVNVSGNYIPAPSWKLSLSSITFLPDGKIMANQRQIGSYQQVAGSYLFYIQIGAQRKRLLFDVYKGRGFVEYVSNIDSLSPVNGSGVVEGDIPGRAPAHH